MAHDVRESAVEVASAEGMTDQERVQRDRHHSRTGLAFLIELIELVDDNIVEGRSAPPLVEKDRDVPDL